MLRRRGIRIPPANRLSEAIRLTERVNAERMIYPGSEMLYPAQEAFRTILEAFVIVHTVIERPRQTGWYSDEMLGKLLRGAPTERAERDPDARNTQFELFLGASLVMCGADVERCEPDFQLLYHQTRIGIAAKRIRSTNPDTLRADLADAAAQISRSCARGLIAVNLDRWLSRVDTSGDVQRLGEDVDAQLSVAHGSMANLADQRSLLGYLYFTTRFDWGFDGVIPSLELHTPQGAQCFSPDGEEQARFAEYFDSIHARWESAVGNIRRLLTARTEEPGAAG